VVHRDGLRLMGVRGKRLGHGAHRAAAMADGGGSSGSASARGERPGWVYMDVEGPLGGRGVNHVTGAHGRGKQGVATCGGAAANGVRRLARRRVETGHLAPSNRSRSSPTVAFRRGAWTAGSVGASACARTVAGVARVRDVARGRALAFPGCWYFT
jgi:hypothetical protein